MTEVILKPAGKNAAKNKRKREKKKAKANKPGGGKTTNQKTMNRKQKRINLSKGQSVNVRGRGAYHLGGSLAWNNPLFSGSIGGYVNDSVATGSGAYKVKRNSLMNALDLTGTVPRVKNMSNGEAFVISHKEYIKDVFSGTFELPGIESSQFTLESFTLNPANAELFPWLAQIAGNFQEYCVTGMLVEFKTTASDLSTTLSLGTVILSADYNALAAPPSNKQTMENMENAGSCKPSCSLIMPIECAPSLTSISTHLFVGPLDAGEGDARLYDMCNIFLATYGIPKEETPIGELWVTYEIAFYKPKLLLLPIQQQHLSWHAIFSGVTNAHPLPSTVTVAPESTSTIEYDPVSNGRILLPSEIGTTYLCVFYSQGNTLATGANFPTLFGNEIEVIPQFGSGFDSLEFPLATENAGRQTVGTIFLIKITGIASRPYVSLGTDGAFANPTCNMAVFLALWNKELSAKRNPRTVPPPEPKKLGAKGEESPLLTLVLDDEGNVGYRDRSGRFCVLDPGGPPIFRPRNEVAYPAPNNVDNSFVSSPTSFGRRTG